MFLVVFSYFTLNILLTLHNKVLLGVFPFPWFLTGIHFITAFLGCLFIIPLHQIQLAKRYYILLLFSILYTINIALSNVSLEMVTIPFHQVVRSTNPLCVILLELMMYRKFCSRNILLTMIPVVLGVCLTSAGEMAFTILGLILTVAGTFTAGLKGIATNELLVGNLSMSPLHLLFFMSPLAFIQTLIYSYSTGELALVMEALPKLDRIHYFSLLLNGIFAFLLSYTSFYANKLTSPLFVSVLGNVKQVLSVVLAIILFSLPVNALNLLGIILTLIGGALYSHISLREKQARYQGLPQSSDLNDSIPVGESKSYRKDSSSTITLDFNDDKD